MNTGLPWETIPLHRPKANSVRFENPYDHIHHINNNHENTHLLYTQEQYMENNEIGQDEFHDDTNDGFIPEEELEHIHPGLDKKILSPTMNSGIMTIHHNGPQHTIDNPEEFRRYLR